MIYSVWDQSRKTYDYYEAPDRGLDGATQPPSPTHVRSGTLGATPNTAAWPLPAGATPAGSGKYPRGMIASRTGGGALGFVSLDFSITNLALLGVLGVVVWKYVLKR